MRCSAYCSATSFDMNGLFDYLKSHYEARRIREVLAITVPCENKQEGQVFLFPYAAIVCWGLDSKQEAILVQQLKPFEFQPSDAVWEDYFNYFYGDKPSIVEDEIELPNNDILTKLAFSHGISQSVKLDSFEATIQNTVNLTRDLPHRLATRGDINLSGKEIQRMMGRLFIDRHSINLHQELLDTPEFFWNNAELEPIYKLTAHYLDCERRVNVLNQRLTVLKELFDMLSNEINHKHSSRLEWTIIWLIVIEVALACAKDIFHWI